MALASHTVPELLTPAQVAEILRCTPRTVHNLIQDGRLPAVRVGRRYRIPRSALDALLNPPAP